MNRLRPLAEQDVRDGSRFDPVAATLTHILDEHEEFSRRMTTQVEVARAAAAAQQHRSSSSISSVSHSSPRIADIFPFSPGATQKTSRHHHHHDGDGSSDLRQQHNPNAFRPQNGVMGGATNTPYTIPTPPAMMTLGEYVECEVVHLGRRPKPLPF